MIDSEIDNLKGFMPKHEGIALTKWSEKFSSIGPIMEIGSYCGKSAIYLSKGAILNDQLVYTIDHHFGSEEHQINEEYFDNEIFDIIACAGGLSYGNNKLVLNETKSFQNQINKEIKKFNFSL
mgnify:CR=1 FL=1